MQKIKQLDEGTPYPIGASVTEDGINFSVVMNTKEECGVILYDRKSLRELARLKFQDKGCKGNIRYGKASGVNAAGLLYRFYCGEQELEDPYGKAFYGKDKKYSCVLDRDYEWDGDEELRIPYRDSIFYLVHVKGFTKHRSSGVEHKGTFLGIAEKIPYLKELGITALELMPAYEFDERMPEGGMEEVPSYMKERYKEVEKAVPKKKIKLNYWGYREGCYFAPKRAYAATDRPDTEFKDMVRRLHQNGIEVIMQFYFPAKVKQGFILEVLKYWILEYHIDGIHVKGDKVPITLLATDPLFGNIKLLYHDMPVGEIYEPKEQPAYKNLAYYRDDFMYDIRKFLKGDEGLLEAFTEYMRRNPKKAGTINYITNYYGFTLADLVSYDKKHNESNGEENRDGPDYNCSWNCGEEGKSRKKSVQRLRMKQVRNALALLFLAQGTPLLRAGDEFLHTQRGNNNPYCQDNEISWLNWDNLLKEQEFLSYVKQLIALRREHPVLHQEEQPALADTLSCGYPDLSYHGEDAWKPGRESGGRHIGLMYCGRYASKADGAPDETIYVAYNMHWQKQSFALPKLPGGCKWELVLATDEAIAGIKPRQDDKNEKTAGKKDKGMKEEVRLPGRSVAVFAGYDYKKADKADRKAQ